MRVSVFGCWNLRSQSVLVEHDLRASLLPPTSPVSVTRSVSAFVPQSAYLCGEFENPPDRWQLRERRGSLKLYSDSETILIKT